MAKTVVVEDLLDKIADLRQSLADHDAALKTEEERVCKPVWAALQAVRNRHARLTETVRKTLEIEEKRCKELVVKLGESVKSDRLEARFSNGRVSWNDQYLLNYGEDHPEILHARSVGNPYVGLYTVK